MHSNGCRVDGPTAAAARGPCFAARCNSSSKWEHRSNLRSGPNSRRSVSSCDGRTLPAVDRVDVPDMETGNRVEIRRVWELSRAWVAEQRTFLSGFDPTENLAMPRVARLRQKLNGELIRRAIVFLAP